METARGTAVERDTDDEFVHKNNAQYVIWGWITKQNTIICNVCKKTIVIKCGSATKSSSPQAAYTWVNLIYSINCINCAPNIYYIY